MLKVVALYDTATTAFGQPIFVRALGEAIRSFIDECKNKESALGKHPADYTLHHLSDFDENTGDFTASAKTQIARGADHE